MNIRLRVSMSAALCATTMALPTVLAAQLAPHQWSFTIAGGFVHGARRDETVSPLRFIGTGPALAIGLARVTDHNRLEFSLTGNSAKLVSDATASDEQLSNGTLAVAVMRTLGTREGVRVDAGIDARLSYDDTYHLFHLAGVASTTYRLASVTAGPGIVVEKRARWGVLRAGASVPLLAVVDHTYSDVKNGYASLRPAFVSLNRLRQANIDVLYTTPNPGQTHLMLGERTNVFSFRDTQPVHSISSMLVVGIVLQQRLAAR